MGGVDIGNPSSTGVDACCGQDDYSCTAQGLTLESVSNLTGVDAEPYDIAVGLLIRLLTPSSAFRSRFRSLMT